VDPETRAYLDDFRRELSSELGRRLDSVEQRVEATRRELGVVIEATRRELGVLIEATRRELGVLIEDVRHDVRAVAEMVVANTEAIGQLRSRLDAR